MRSKRRPSVKGAVSFCVDTAPSVSGRGAREWKLFAVHAGFDHMSSTPKFRRETSGASDLRAPPHSDRSGAGGARRPHARSHGLGQRRRRGRGRNFFRPDHKLIFESIAALAGEAQPCDPVTVSEHLQRLGKLNDAGGLAYLGTLTRDTPGAANVRAYAEIVKERALLRELVSAGGEIASSVWTEEGESARDLVETAERRIFAIAEGSSSRQGICERAAGTAAVDRPDRRPVQQP